MALTSACAEAAIDASPSAVYIALADDTGLVTAFTVRPGGGGKTIARISSEWDAARGLRGLVDRWVTPVLARRIFAAQLRRLTRYMQSEEAPA